MTKPRLSAVCLFLSSAFASQFTLADRIELDDGSVLNGEIQQISDGKVLMNTAFADEIAVDYQRVTAIETDSKYQIQLDSNDRVTGRITVDESGQHQLADTAFGTVDINPGAITALWAEGDTKPQVEEVEQAYQQKLAELETSSEQEAQQMREAYETQLQQVREERDQLRDPWSGNIAMGLQGAKGNTERFAATGRGELFRTTEAERMAMYLEINYAKEDDEQTENEKLAGISLERDITDRVYARGSADFEIDDFEELDLRAIATASIGRFFIREPDLTFKGFAGVGYRFESFQDGTTEKDPTGVLGYETNYNLNSRLNLFHNLTYYPSFSSPGQNYLVVTDFGGEMPITEDESWKLRGLLRSQYNSQPAEGAETTDTTYRLNLVYDWD